MLTAVAALFIFSHLSFAAEDSNGDEGQKYLFRYDLNSGEQLHYEVTHVAKTKTRIRGAEEISQVHTVSQRHWDIAERSPEETTFDHVVDAVEMTQQQGEAEEVRWDSESGDQPPAIFERVAEQIGTRISTVTVTPRGQEKKRENNGGTKATLGMGSLTIAFPEEAIAIGESWSIPREVKARTEDSEVKTIKIRELYTLEKVKTGVATLSVRSEPLTPLNDDSVRAQVVQQLSNGEIRFDLDNGRMLSKQLEWDETIVGFQGANSLMEYRARLSEKLVDGVQRTARR
ncbi:MAG: hypothetical protein ACR2NZ_15020 [Rubripirellula sp.]